jgi:hypothetical protein
MPTKHLPDIFFCDTRQEFLQKGYTSYINVDRMGALTLHHHDTRATLSLHVSVCDALREFLQKGYTSYINVDRMGTLTLH